MSYKPVKNLDEWDDDVVPTGKPNMDLASPRLKAAIAARKIVFAAQKLLNNDDIPAKLPLQTSGKAKC